jgi:hypothetical protein
MTLPLPLCACALLVLAVRPPVELERDDSIQLLAVDPVHGNDRAAGTEGETPALDLGAPSRGSPIRWRRSAIIALAPAVYDTTGGIGMSEHSLLWHAPHAAQ